MALGECIGAVDTSRRELIEHGTAAFPIACYQDDLAMGPVPWHWHEEWEAGIIPAGSAVLTVGQKEFVLNAGEGFLINSGILHGVYAPAGSKCLIRSLVFHGRLIGGAADSIFYRKYLHPLRSDPTLDWVRLSPDTPWHREAIQIIGNTWGLCVREDPGYEFTVRSGLSRLMLLLHQNRRPPLHSPNGKALRDSDRLKQMLSFIHDHFADELNTRQIAAAAAISESECLRCFRSGIGTTPIQYLKQHRLRQAAGLLLSTQDKVSDIAARCGFPDVSYFTKSFREANACTPTEYRAK